MMNEELEVNGYSIYFETTKLDRPIGGARRHEVKVIRIID